MGRWATVLFAIACGACGRIGFDLIGGSDAIGGHDEDEDGVADVDDVCPHLAGSQADTDGDRIGDDCDPEPGIGRQTLILFATMQAGDQPLVMELGTWTERADAIRVEGIGHLSYPIALGDYRVAVGVDVEAERGAGQHQIGLGARSVAAQHYFVELNEGPGYNQAAVVHYDGSIYTSLAFMPMTTGFHPGRVFLQATQIASTRVVTLVGGWEGEPYMLTAAAPDYDGGTDVRLFLSNLDAEVRFVWIVGW